MKRAQQGMSFLGILVSIAVLALLLKIVMALFPAYYDDRVINQQIQEVLKNTTTSASADEFKSDLAKRLELNSIRDLNVDDIVQVEVTNSGLVVHKNYQRHAVFFKNVEFVTSFSQDFNQQQSIMP